MSTTMRNYTDSTTATLFEMFDTAAETNMYDHHHESASEMSSKPRQVLGESVFSRFVKSEDLVSEFPALGLEKLDMPELSPSVGTVTPLQLHSSIVESIFSPSMVDSTPMFDDVELDSSNWTSLFEPSEMEIPIKKEPVASPAVESAPVAAAPAPTQFTPIESVVSSPLFEDVSFGSKRSASEADLSDDHESKRSASMDHMGLTAYNRKQRTQPLSPIVVDAADPVAAKRARNTEAARRSRARKMERMYQLEEKVEDLSSRNRELEAEVHRLRALLGQH